LVFGRDIILNIKYEANWEIFHARKQKIIQKNNEAENAKRTPDIYAVGDKVWLKRGMENKYEAPYAHKTILSTIKTSSFTNSPFCGRVHVT
jgi:hypothetical protein